MGFPDCWGGCAGAKTRRSPPQMPDRPQLNAVQELREDQLLSKAELARRAGVSVLTIDRVERGLSCRLDTKRKIILALGLKVEQKGRVFFDPTGKRARRDRR